MKPRRAPLLLVLALTLWPATARSQTATDRAAIAQGLYEAAAALMRAGHYAEACPKLEESQRLDPAMGTQFFLATCYEATGRPTTAWSLFLEVASAAKADGNAVRESTAHARAAALESKLPRVSIVVGAAAAAIPGLVLTRDGIALKPVVWGSPVPVDLGPHVVRATAPGKAPWETTVRVGELGQKLEVTVPVLADAKPGAAQPVVAPSEPPAPPPVEDTASKSAVVDAQDALRRISSQRIAALSVGAAGVAGAVVGGVLGMMARSAWNQADAACPTHMACSKDAHDGSVRALSLATGSTAAFVVGGATVATSVILWITSPRPASTARVRIAPFAGARVMGVAAEGAF
jgi:hypothetical protein